MTLAELLHDALDVVPVWLSAGQREKTVRGVEQDSRRVSEGFVFVARRGDKHNGHRFARRAVEQGAVAIVGEHDYRGILPWGNLPFSVPYISVDNDKLALARLAAAYHRHPSKQLTVIGVTGTDGKTTTSYLLLHLLTGRFETGLLSTAGIRLGRKQVSLEGHFTSPEAPQVQGLLAEMLESGCSHAIVESSSHGLAMHRLSEIDYDLGVWTNLSPEHLDYHGSLEAYRNAKLELVKRAPLSVLNADDPACEVFAASSNSYVTYGLENGSQWQARDIEQQPDLLRWKLVSPERTGQLDEVCLPMLGLYNVPNALAALAAATRLGVPLQEAIARLATFPGVPGRTQIVQRQPFAVVVDFAHTGPALTKVLQSLRAQTRGRLIVVVGSAGERDPAKRGPLGESAQRHADLAVFTEEDHRSEPLDAILEAMSRGAERAGGVLDRSFFVVPDRREAIAKAIGLAQEGDSVVLAGKGHEQTLERGDEVLAWDEVAEAKRALAAP